LGAGVLGMPVVAGALATSYTGRLGSGPLAGFWCGIAAALLIALSTLVLDVVLTSHFLQGSWLHDHYCNFHTGDALAACEIDDDLGFASNTLVTLPLAMAALGVIGGAFGLANPRERSATTRVGAKSSRAPLIFSLIMAAIFLAELFLRFW